MGFTVEGYDPTNMTNLSGGKGFGPGSYYSGSYGSSGPQVTVPEYDSPEPIDYHELSQQYNLTGSRLAPKRYVKGFNDLIAATSASNNTAAGNATTAYANRLMQLGIAPLDAGVVGAKIQQQGRQEVAGLKRQKEEVLLEAQGKRQSLLAMIANQIAGVRTSYSQTLADYNYKNAALNVDAQKANQDAWLKYMAYFGDKSGKSGTGTTGPYPGASTGGYAGYVPNSGPIDPSYGTPYSTGRNVLGTYPDERFPGYKGLHSAF